VGDDFRLSDHGPECRCRQFGGANVWMLEVQAERRATIDELQSMLVDAQIVDLAEAMVGNQDWDMNRVRLWIAMLRVGDVFGSRL